MHQLFKDEGPIILKRKVLQAHQWTCSSGNELIVNAQKMQQKTDGLLIRALSCSDFLSAEDGLLAVSNKIQYRQTEFLFVTHYW